MERSEPQIVDFICQHSRNGSIIPLKIRLTDDDGMYQTYTIKSFRDLSHQGSREMPDGMYVSDSTTIFECVISDFGQRKVIRLYNQKGDDVWKMTY